MQSMGNAARSARTRAALLAAGRTVFVRDGYEAASTPQVVALAGLTRGALYHHFADKRELFRAIVQEESRVVAERIERSTAAEHDPIAALQLGSAAYLDAMAAPGRTMLLLIEAPAALGRAETAALDDSDAARTLREGLDAARPGEDNAALAMLLSAAFDRAALAIDEGADPRGMRAAMGVLIDRVAAP